MSLDPTPSPAIKPVFVTFRDLMIATVALHTMRKPYLDALHDVWLMGAPSPGSRVLAPKGYDPRKLQDGNHEARLLLAGPLTRWIVDVSRERGIAITQQQANDIAQGKWGKLNVQR